MGRHRHRVVMLAAGAAVVVAGCGSSAGHPSSTTAATTTTTTTVASTTTTVASTTSSSTTATTIQPTTTTASTARPGYAAARAAWTKGSADNAAEQPGDWLQAASDLTAGLSQAGNTTGYATAIGQLKYIASLPDTDVPPNEAAAEQADVAALNTFFATPGLYG